MFVDPSFRSEHFLVFDHRLPADSITQRGSTSHRLPRAIRALDRVRRTSGFRPDPHMAPTNPLVKDLQNPAATDTSLYLSQPSTLGVDHQLTGVLHTVKRGEQISRR
jgi:hypothetical protein